MNEDPLFDEIRRAAESKQKRVDVSLQGVAFLSSGMINMFLQANKLANSLGVELRFVDASPNVVEVFMITKLNKLLHIEGETP